MVTRFRSRREAGQGMQGACLVRHGRLRRPIDGGVCWGAALLGALLLATNVASALDLPQPCNAALFDGPEAVAVDSAGNLYVADTNNSTIRKITPAGVVSTLAGMAGYTSGSADGRGSDARLNYPFGVATDSLGNVYVADTDNDAIRKITPDGWVSTLAGAAGHQGSADGSGSAAQFRYPINVATDSAGNVYVADEDNQTIRKITPAGVVSTLAGTVGQSGSTDDIGTAARFNEPPGVATDAAGNVFVADTGNQTIRKITPSGVVSTFAGMAQQSGSANGTGSAARFHSPNGMATDEGSAFSAQSGSLRNTGTGSVKHCRCPATFARVCLLQRSQETKQGRTICRA